MSALKTYFFDVIAKQYIHLQGCASRKQYWMYALFYIVVNIVLGILSSMDNILGILFFICFMLYSLALLLPSISISVRRLHDINRSGWWLLIFIVPMLGTLIWLVFMLWPGTPGPNRFGNQN